ncbi:MAG TPA: efflux transporter outer membrane subunit [Usitatibacter sp.]|nr:efflux transporter outer membrane subunit [Usitatibacter sp.]
MKILNWTPVYTGVTAALILAGCATAPEIDPQSIPATPVAFKEGDGRWTRVAPAEARPRGEWWKAFADPVLDELVARAELGNTDLQVAAARLAQGRALVRAADAERLPQLFLGGGAVRTDGLPLTQAGAPRTLATASANAAWEVDLFGRLASASRAASLDAQSREGLLQSTRLAVQASVAQAYLSLRATDAERALVRGTVSTYVETLKLTERRFQAGDVAELDVARARTEVAATESDALALDRRRAELEHALAVLVGEPASTFQLAETKWDTALPVIPAGVPGTVLARRPDVSAAQLSLLASQQRVGVAKAAWFPSVVLTGSAGHASSEVADLFKWSARAWGIGALLSLPVFDGGSRQAGVDNATAEMDIALARYREQILGAFRDVEDQLAALHLLAEQADAQSRAVASAARTTQLSDARYRGGFVSQLELLDAQRSELRNRRQALQVRAAQYQATVGLVRALGGGWDA